MLLCSLQFNPRFYLYFLCETKKKVSFIFAVKVSREKPNYKHKKLMSNFFRRTFFYNLVFFYQLAMIGRTTNNEWNILGNKKTQNVMLHLLSLEYSRIMFLNSCCKFKSWSELNLRKKNARRELENEKKQKIM